MSTTNDLQLTLPPSFGSAYVGENFSCTLCASVELPNPVTQRRLISNIRILADLQTPTQTIPLDLSPPSASAVPETSDLLQKIVRYDLKEEGSHVLAVTVTYSETAQSLEVDGKPAPASGGRVRTFRKLYQFEAKQCIAVRTKATELPSRTKLAGQTERCRRFVLEAQLENMSENSISLMVEYTFTVRADESLTFDQELWLTPKAPFKSISMLDGLKHDISATAQTLSTVTVINPRDVAQVSFILEPDEISDIKRVERPPQELERDGRVTLAQLHIKWRTEMGGEGGLNTGWLGSRPKR